MATGKIKLQTRIRSWSGNLQFDSSGVAVVKSETLGLPSGIGFTIIDVHGQAGAWITGFTYGNVNGLSVWQIKNSANTKPLLRIVYLLEY